MILGRFKGRVFKERKPVWTHAKSGSLSLPVDLALRNEKGDLVQTVTSFLSFASSEAAAIQVERLRALGWKGTPAELAVGDIKGPLDQEVDVQVSERDFQGEKKVDVDILTGGGRFKVKPEEAIDPRVAGARLAAVMGLVATPAAPASGGTKTPW